MTFNAVRHRVVVIRVETPEAGGDPWRVEVLEVGRHVGGDRLLGRATGAAETCRIVQDWFIEISGTRAPPEPAHDNA